MPAEVGNLKSLRTLNISENNSLQGVPPTLAHVRTLEVRGVNQSKFSINNGFSLSVHVHETPKIYWSEVPIESSVNNKVM